MSLSKLCENWKAGCEGYGGFRPMKMSHSAIGLVSRILNTFNQSLGLVSPSPPRTQTYLYCTHIHPYTYIHTYIHTYLHTHTHVHTYTRTCIQTRHIHSFIYFGTKPRHTPVQYDIASESVKLTSPDSVFKFWPNRHHQSWKSEFTLICQPLR